MALYCFEDLPQKMAKKKSAQRISVSAEAYGMFNQKKAFVPRVIEKSMEARERLSKRLSEAFMFSNLDEKEKNIVQDAMEEMKFKTGDYVIKQGDDGETQFVVDEGKLDCFKKFTVGAEDTYLKTYIPGEAFGELALLYNAPRAASIIAKEDSVCFSLDLSLIHI